MISWVFGAIVIFVVMIGVLITTIIFLKLRERLTEPNRVLAINLRKVYSPYGLLLLDPNIKDVGNNKLKLTGFPRDIYYKQDKKGKTSPPTQQTIIAPADLVIQLPKGTLSPERDFCWILPNNNEELKDIFKGTSLEEAFDKKINLSNFRKKVRLIWDEYEKELSLILRRDARGVKLFRKMSERFDEVMQEISKYKKEDERKSGGGLVPVR